MKMNFPEDSATNPPADQLQKGDTVTVVGASQRRGHLIVEQHGTSFQVPFQFMELVKGTITVDTNTATSTTAVAAATSVAAANVAQATSCATTNLI